MCEQYLCLTCGVYFFDHCNHVGADPERACAHSPNIQRFCKDCEACTLVQGAIHKLRHLTYQFSFLETHGLAGIESLASWEQEGARQILFKDLSNPSWEARIESIAEKTKALNNAHRMGLMGMEDKRTEHQGFGSTPLRDTVGNDIREDVRYEKIGDKADFRW